MHNVHISIIIVGYNTKEVIRNCLSSIYQNPSEQPSEIIVVDNNSLDGSQDAIERQFPEVILVRNSENVGFAGANNQGIKISKGKYILILNPDTVLFPEALDRMVAFMEKNPEVGAITPKIWLDERKTLQSCILHPFTIGNYIFAHSPIGRAFLHNWVLKKLWKKDIEIWLAEGPLEVDCIAGTCIMVRREVLKTTGRLDDYFFMFFEDVDWCLRMKKTGWRLFLVPDAEIMHMVHQSPSDRISEIHRNSQVYYLRKHYCRPAIWFSNKFISFCGIFLKFKSYIDILYDRKNVMTVSETGSNRLQWPEINGAKGYILEISSDRTFLHKGAGIIENNSYEFPVEMMQRWSYNIFFWRVAPIYHDGSIGEFSITKSVTKIQKGYENAS
jgi:GT2 family glycosyltransferase